MHAVEDLERKIECGGFERGCLAHGCRVLGFCSYIVRDAGLFLIHLTPEQF
jgi:hypothetical protein